MNILLVLAFLFFMGSLIGWGIEVLFRRFISRANPERKWINPGFMTGPYLPLYGLGLVFLFLIAGLEKYSLIKSPFWNKIVLFVFMALCMTLIEYIAGILSRKLLKVELWDYSDQWGNIQGIICPLFSFFWALMGAAYYFLVHPYILNALAWLSQNLAFSFFIGLFYGVFIIDFVHSTQLLVAIRRFAAENQIEVRFEELRDRVRQYNESRKIRAKFMFSMSSDLPIREHLAAYYEETRQKIDQKKQELDRKKQEHSKKK
ncbi:MAG: hypothetical protein ACI4PC_02650 [Oscillospiraceae bacterium]